MTPSDIKSVLTDYFKDFVKSKYAVESLVNSFNTNVLDHDLTESELITILSDSDNIVTFKNKISTINGFAREFKIKLPSNGEIRVIVTTNSSDTVILNTSLFLNIIPEDS